MRQSSEAHCSVMIKLSSRTYYTVSQLGAPVSSRLFLLKIKAAAEHLWLLWMWQNTLSVKTSQRKSLPEKRVPLSGCFLPARISHLEKCLLSWIWNSIPVTHTHRINQHSRVGISHFLMSNISLVSAVTEEQLFPCRRPLTDGGIEGIP